MRRFILVILDSFGIGAMDDVAVVRPQDRGANTCKHIMLKKPNVRLFNLEKMGLMNALGEEVGAMKYSVDATFGQALLQHYGADTFCGHQEIMGTKPLKSIFAPFSMYIDDIERMLVKLGYSVKRIGNRVKYLLVNQSLTIADNIEADVGQIYNVTAALDNISFDEVLTVGRIVRDLVPVSRVIALGGKGVTVQDLMNSAEEKEGTYIGINCPKSGVYNFGYRVIHLGYGVDATVQVPTLLGKAGIDVSLFGKAADIIHNEYGKSVPCVDTEKVMKLTLKEMDSMENGFIAVNVQETDLAGHEQDVEKYISKLIIADDYIGKINNKLTTEDILVVMADHGNDPTIGHSHHTRECVPLLIRGQHIKKGYIGRRSTLADVGATVCDYFGTEVCEFGTSFLKEITINGGE